MKKLIIGLLIICILILNGCEEIDLSKVSEEDIGKVAEKVIVCDSPYIRHASGCCLDQNNNGICDKDEEIQVAETIPETPQTEPQKQLNYNLRFECTMNCELPDKNSPVGLILLSQQIIGDELELKIANFNQNGDKVYCHDVGKEVIVISSTGGKVTPIDYLRHDYSSWIRIPLDVEDNYMIVCHAESDIPTKQIFKIK